MIGRTRSARLQIFHLLYHYMALNRQEAIDNLAQAVATALRLIESGQGNSRSYPANYELVASYGFRWIKVHLYWFGYSMQRSYPILTNVLHDSADIPRRIAADDDDALLPS